MFARMKIVAIAGLIVVMLAAFGFTPTAMAREKVVMDGSTTVYPIAKAFAGYYMAKHPDVKVTVSGTGSGNGAKSLVQGSCDIACMSRFMKDKEFKMAIDDGIHPVFHTVAMDGIAVAVHPSNPVNGLTLEQLRKIYNGKIANWNEVGGPNKDIVVISRDSTSGTFEVFGDLVLKGDRLTGGAERAASNAEVQQRVKTTQSAIGYLGLGYIEGVKAVAVNGVKPNVKTVGSGQYAIARPLFMVTNGYPALGSPEQAIVTMYLKPYGQEMIKDIGYVPVTQY